MGREMQVSDSVVIDVDPERSTAAPSSPMTWTDARLVWPDRTAAAFDRTVTGGRLLSDFQRRNIRRTLATMKTEFESGDRSA